VQCGRTNSKGIFLTFILIGKIIGFNRNVKNCSGYSQREFKRCTDYSFVSSDRIRDLRQKIVFRVTISLTEHEMDT
jgi:hypothetical protein